MESGEVQIFSVHDVKRTGVEAQIVQMKDNRLFDITTKLL